MEGYARLATRISQHPELGIYRRFAALNAQNILYLQAEIHELEADLRRYAEEDCSAPKPNVRIQYSRNWHKLAHVSSLQDDPDRKQWSTICLLRERLKEYNEVLTQQALIATHYRPPRTSDLDILKTILNSPKFPDYLLGLDSSIWDDPLLKPDLVTLASHDTETDSLTLFLGTYIIQPFHRFIGRHLYSPSSSNPSSPPDPNADLAAAGIMQYSDIHIARLSSLLATVISSVFPIVGVIILYFVHDLLARIGIIAALTALFSATLALVTTARKSEIFAATAAFSAVLVVFLGTS